MFEAVASRRYDMQARNRAVAAARAHAVKAAYELLLQPQCRELGVDAVACRAGVTRVTLYNQFGSRGGLLVALFQELGRRIGAERIHAAMRLPEPLEAMTEMIRESTRGLWREQQAVRKILAFSVLDEEMHREVERAESARRESLLHLVKRLSAAHRLSLGQREAAALLAGLTSFQAFEALVPHAGPKLVERRLQHLARAGLGISGAKGRQSERTGRRRLGRRG
jgi:AcrR family transcriptional regulator